VLPEIVEIGEGEFGKMLEGPRNRGVAVDAVIAGRAGGVGGGDGHGAAAGEPEPLPVSGQSADIAGLGHVRFLAQPLPESGLDVLHVVVLKGHGKALDDVFQRLGFLAVNVENIKALGEQVFQGSLGRLAHGFR